MRVAVPCGLAVKIGENRFRSYTHGSYFGIRLGAVYHNL